MLPEEDYESEILRLERPLRAFLHRLAPQPADLEDLLQETYSRLFRLSADQRRGVRNLSAFAMTTARNVALNWIRHRQVVSIDSMGDLDDLLLSDESADLEAIAHCHQQLLRLSDSVARLPERCRQVFCLRHVQGLSQKEIAQRFGISIGAVEQLLVRGMHRCLQDMGDAGAAGRDGRGGRIARWLQDVVGRRRSR